MKFHAANSGCENVVWEADLGNIGVFTNLIFIYHTLV